MTIKLFETNRTFNGAVSRFTTNAAKQNELLHSIMASAVYLAEQDMNVDRFAKAISMLPAGGSRRKHLKAWAEKFAPVFVKLDKGGDVKVAMLKGKRKAAHPGWDLEGAKETSPDELAVEQGKKAVRAWTKVDQYKAALERAATKAAKELGLTSDQLGDIMAATSAELQAGDIVLEVVSKNSPDVSHNEAVHQCRLPDILKATR